MDRGIKASWFIIFFSILSIHLAGILLDHDLILKISKPLLMPVLLAGLVTELRPVHTKLKPWIFTALIFSWVGDVLLMFQEKDKLFFLAGLGSFLLAHICYIVSFHKMRVVENIKSNAGFLVIVVIYYASLIAWLGPYLGDMKIPVRIYGIVISFMVMIALHLFFIRNRIAGRLMALGAILFIISDTLIAISMFYSAFFLSGFLIMLTYGFAQALIVYGAMKYIRNQTDQA